MLPVMVPVHLLGEMVKPVSLLPSLRQHLRRGYLIVVCQGRIALPQRRASWRSGSPMAESALFMLQTPPRSCRRSSSASDRLPYMMLPHEKHGYEEGGHAH